MQYSKDEKTMWLEKWRQSGKSARTYAMENDINPQTFYSWTKPGKKTDQPMVEIPTEVFSGMHLTQEILIEKGEIKIHIPIEPVINELHTIIKKIGLML